jgi:hypothetical protein
MKASKFVWRWGIIIVAIYREPDKSALIHQWRTLQQQIKQIKKRKSRRKNLLDTMLIPIFFFFAGDALKNSDKSITTANKREQNIFQKY